MKRTRLGASGAMIGLRRIVLMVGGCIAWFAASAALAEGWSPTGSMFTSRSHHTATALADGRVLVSGGYASASLPYAEIFDQSLGAWSPTASMNSARYYHTATALPDGRVLVVGGYGASGYLASAEIYDAASGTWSSAGSMSRARFLHTATALPDGRVLVSGGYDSGAFLTGAEIYDPALGIWTVTGSMGTPRYLHAATLLKDGRVLVSGAYSGSAYLDSAEIYDPVLGAWSPTGSMSTPRYFHTITLLQDGRVVASGGHSGSGFLATAEIYDPAFGTWSPTGSMSGARYIHRATQLPGGGVLVTGGNSGASSLASAEIYDVGLGAWLPAGSMSTARYIHAAVLLPDGGVLVSGGVNESGVTASAEIFAGEVVNVEPVITAVAGPTTPVPIGTAVSIQAAFTDGDSLDSHTCTFGWGDGTPDTVVNAAGTGNGTCSATHTYTASNVYEVEVTVADDDGGSAESTFQYVVVYDPSGGFVTGGGWIMSPAGAYAANPALTGKANFGFVSKYKAGSSVPAGNTEFQFKAADLNFASTSYEWMVISGAKARYRGVGQINGAGEYGFELTAWDGNMPGGGGTDRFRLQIWDANRGNAALYDNQMGSADGADPTTALGGGSIVIHK